MKSMNACDRIRFRLAYPVASILVASLALASACSSPYPPPPETLRHAVTDTLHGVEFIDRYRWLEDQDAPATRTWIDAQNAYAEEVIGQSPLRTELRERLRALMDDDDFGWPSRHGDHEYFWLRRAGTDLPVIYRRPAADSASPIDADDDYEAVIDPHEMSPDHTTRVATQSFSPDDKYVIYSVRDGGQDEVEIRVRDLEASQDLPDKLPNGLYSSISWNQDGSGFYYSARSRETGARIRFHRLGTEVSDDEELFGAGYGPDKFVGMSQLDGGRYFLYEIWHGWTRIEVHVQDVANDGQVVTIAGADLDARFYPQFHDGELYMRTNLDAPNNRIVAVDLDRPERENWRDVISESDDVLQGFTFIDDRLYVTYLHDVSTEIKIFEPDGTAAGEVDVPKFHTASMWSAGEDRAYLNLTSFTQPSITYRVDLETGEREVWREREVDFDAEGIEVRQLWYTSKDGTRVPMFVMHRVGLELTGDHPTWLYGYGGFIAALTPRFDPMVAAWVERGGVYAMANLRGGSEFGERWHRAGMLGDKQNVFDDFIAAAEYLIEAGYTNPKKLAIRGFTETNNLPALHEYGNAAIPEQFEFLSRYSPYQRVKDGTKYPAVILTSGDLDTRVPPLQARKMTARLQAATKSGLPVILRYDPKGGHAANRGRPFSKAVDDNAAELAFVVQQVFEVK